MRTRHTTAQEWFDAFSNHFVSGSPCEKALVQCDDCKDRLEIGVKCSLCGRSWAIHVRHLWNTIGKMTPQGAIRVWDHRKVDEREMIK